MTLIPAVMAATGCKLAGKLGIVDFLMGRWRDYVDEKMDGFDVKTETED